MEWWHNSIRTDKATLNTVESRPPIVENLLSVVVPAKKPHEFLQTFLNPWARLDNLLINSNIFLEIIFVHSGDDDNLANSFPNFSNIKLKYYHTSQLWGASKSRNFGLQMADAEYVFFHDVDDQIIPYPLYDLLLFLDSNRNKESIDMYTFDYIKSSNGEQCIVDHKAHFHSPELEQSKLIEYTINYLNEPHKYTLLVHVWSKLFKLRYLQVNDVSFNERLEQLEDVNFNFRVLLLKPKIQRLNIAFYQYTANSSSQNLSKLSGARGKESIREVIRAYIPVKQFLMKNVSQSKRDLRLALGHFYSTTLILWLLRAIKNVPHTNFSALRQLVRAYSMDPVMKSSIRYYRHFCGTSFFLPILLKLNLPTPVGMMMSIFPKLRKGF